MDGNKFWESLQSEAEEVQQGEFTYHNFAEFVVICSQSNGEILLSSKAFVIESDNLNSIKECK